MTTYTKIAKPTGTTYTNTNTVGKEQYDQTYITYDDATVFYDGVNYSQYTKVAKPSETGLIWNDINGDWDANTELWSSLGVSLYTKVPKP